jgi:hypothetical protein
MVVLPLGWFVCWAAGDLQKRWALLAGFIATLATLMGASELVLPGWLRYFFAGLEAYRKYAHHPPLFELALGARLGEILAGAVLVGLLAIAWQNRKEAGDSRQFTMMLAMFLTATMLTLPLLPLFNQLLLILPSLIVLRDWASLRTPSRYIFIAILAWPSIASIALLLLFVLGSHPSTRLPLLPSMLAFFFPFILPFLLVRRRRTGSPGSFYDGDTKQIPLT